MAAGLRRTVAIIPARGGSKAIPLKNLQRVGGKTLLTRAIESARRAVEVDDVYVSTDHAEIANEARLAGAQVVQRPPELATDTATSESAVLHALRSLDADYEVTLLIQCTSPFIDPAAIDNAVQRVRADQADVVFSAVEDHSFMWALDAEQQAIAVGHDAHHRPRRQDRPPQYNETGAFYAMRTAGLLAAGHRFFGRIGVEEVPPEHSREIDTLADLTLARQIAATDASSGYVDALALVTDFDGVHTDDAVHVDQDGRESVRVHRGDGMGVSRLVGAGVPVMILSKERNPVVSARARKLSVEVRQGIDDKAVVLKEWMAEKQLDPRHVAYVGNDVNDLAAFGVVGWPIAVADAHPDVLAAARIVLQRRGGQGAVREVCDLIPLPGQPWQQRLD